jgi:hypothetical protein
MATTIWTIFAIATMVAIFATCVAVVAAGVRLFENALSKRRTNRPG